ncbi:MAG: Hsp20/alpha crystallin family protein [Syntrophaceticus sp.]|nr:Hsp20/alpha crystallin family protein [Syntrophaceticus sp.]MDD3314221.1 Hsp20/alpha crystallin family protein [Syntrophaceticus sp.]MDD4360003.1 Hsp20/alpha crystallin family protein [Syntrophaceticus sp.]MDD4783254.1 Hsp20/alpha crystallin family protein [Syntrophaceticus sp.]
MTSRRKDHWRELAAFKDGVNQVFDETVGKHLPVSSLSELFEWKPFVDIVDEDEQFVIKADLPGYDPSNIEIKVTENSVNIRGKIDEEHEYKDSSYQIRERGFGSFTRNLSLSGEVKPDEAKASFRNGVLEIKLPKVQVPKGRKLDIETE